LKHHFVKILTSGKKNKVVFWFVSHQYNIFLPFGLKRICYLTGDSKEYYFLDLVHVLYIFLKLFLAIYFALSNLQKFLFTASYTYIHTFHYYWFFLLDTVITITID